MHETVIEREEKNPGGKMERTQEDEESVNEESPSLPLVVTPPFPSNLP